MFIWAQSIDEINAMERDLIGSETEHQLKEEETLIADGKCSFNVLSSTSSAISMPIPSSSTPPSLPARSARFSTCTSPLSFEKQRRLSLISSTRNSSQGSADSNGSICCKRIDLIKSEDDEIMGGEQHIRVSSNSATFSSPVIKHAAAHRRTSIQSARLRRHNLKKIDINYNNDINNTNSPPQSPPPMSHGRRTSTVFREILLGNLRVEDVTFPDKASSTAAATVGSSLPDCDSNTSFNQLETSSLASTSTVSNCVVSETKLSASIKPQKIIKPPLQRNDSIASTSTTTSTFSFFKSLFSRRTTRTSQQNSQASSECGMSGRRKSSLAKVIDEEQEDLDGGEERERICNQSIIKEKLINEKEKNKLEEENLPMEPFVSSNGNNNTRIKDGIVSPSNLPASSISSTRTMSSTSVGNESSAHSTTATTTTTNIEQQQSTKQKSSKRSSDLRIFIVWLERLEDMATFPFAEMFPFTTSINDYNCKNLTSMNSTNQQPTTTTIDHLIFYIFPFEKGLRRIQIDGIWTKQGKPGPLHNGTVVSSRALPSLLRQTICNISRRKAVEIDNYQMTHLKRKQAIAEFGRRFATRLDYTEFVEQLLKNNSSSFGTVFPP
ncbi:hypothetical protein Mgra_00001202 [Meloidogyne graminicola]|uniref:Uncharacterized protein n=1 Tax=Meloidogyne graminicola TaxID=189291 RepID=A0A8S9ZZT7_9BILA|nr:hypothetical protein Mgra_00001202 [Meloidogyne graminicola]